MLRSKRYRCCDINDVCGYTLRQGTKFVGVATLVIAVIILGVSVGYIVILWDSHDTYNDSPVRAIDLIFALCCATTSIYQIIITVLLLWFAIWDKGSPYLLSIWYVSNLTIITIYTFLLTTEAIIYFNAKLYIKSFFIVMTGVIYNCVLIYFCIIVNSYWNSIHPHRAYH